MQAAHDVWVRLGEVGERAVREADREIVGVLARDLRVEPELDEMVDHPLDVAVAVGPVAFDHALFAAGIGRIFGVEAGSLGEAKQHARQGGEHGRFKPERWRIVGQAIEMLRPPPCRSAVDADVE